MNYECVLEAYVQLRGNQTYTPFVYMDFLS